MDLPEVDRVQPRLLQGDFPLKPQTLLIASADAKLDKLLLLGFRFLIFGMSPEKSTEKSIVQAISFWTFLAVFYFIYGAYVIVVAVFFARNLIETVTNFYIFTYLTALSCQWAYLYSVFPKLYSNRALLKDFQCVKSCPEFAEKLVDENVGYLSKILLFFLLWVGGNAGSHVFGPIVEAVLAHVRGDRALDKFFIFPQVFELPMWGQIMMYFWNGTTTSGLVLFCVGSNAVLGEEVVRIKVLCEVLRTTLENASDVQLIGKYIRDHTEIIKRAKELTKHMATVNIFVFTSGYLEFATQMYIITFFDVNFSYLFAVVLSMISVFLLVAFSCFMGSQITDSLQSVAYGPYFAKWYEDKSLSKHVILMAQMSQNKFEQNILFGSIKVERAAAMNVCSVCGASAKIGGWDTSPNTQYHIQTDEGPERYFKYQTVSGQYRKEKRLQDGTVVGSYGWVDANGILRLRDYIADDKGYRIVRTKTVKVGDMAIDNAISLAKKTPTNSAAETAAYAKPAPVSLDTYLKEKQKTAPISYDDYIKQKLSSTPKPISLSDYLREKQLASTTSPVGYSPNVEVNVNGYPSTTPAPESTTSQYSTASPEYVRPITFRPYFNFNSLTPDKKAYESRYVAADSQHVPRYDGVSQTRNGFRYYLPRHYHEETTLPGQQRAGSFGYIDPFGIRRVIYYNTSPGSGFIHRKNNRYVGFQSTPYDPRF